MTLKDVSQSLLNEVWFPTHQLDNNIVIQLDKSQSLLNEVWFPTVIGDKEYSSDQSRNPF